MNEEIDLLDVLLDFDNKEPIVLMDESGRQIAFEQIAVIPYRVESEIRLYCILKPLGIQGVSEDEAIVFLLDVDDDGNSVICIEEDEQVAIGVFSRYYKLLEEDAPETLETAQKMRTELLQRKLGRND